jgi:hypothetical protein
LREQLPTINVYEERDAVRGAQLLGRDEETSTLQTKIVRGDAVAVLGLRKVGKTSLVRAVTDSLDPASGVEASSHPAAASSGVVVWMDAEAVIEPNVDAVTTELLRALRQRTRSAGEDDFSIPDSGGLLDWKRTCERILDAGRRLTVVIDEYDVLFESGAERAPIPGLSRLFRLMRAWSQLRQGQFSLVMIGRDPSFISYPELDQATSPLFLWCSPMWLGPLRSGQDTLLLRRLGKRVGLQIGHRSGERARIWTGGHPMLHRQFGAALWTLMRSRKYGWGTDSDQLLDAADDSFVARKDVSAIARELRELLRQRYPDALRLLVDLIHSDPNEAVALHGGPASDAYVLLKNFGVLGDEANTVPRYLRWYFKRYAPEGVTAQAG